MLYHDQIGRNVLRSPDEGKKWDHINGVPKGESIMLIEHPYDKAIVRLSVILPARSRSIELNRRKNKIAPFQAFILTASTTHYRTMNKGETWSSFKTALPPSLSANTLGFNAKKWDWILYTGQKCESMGGWGGKICHDEVSPSLSPSRP